MIYPMTNSYTIPSGPTNTNFNHVYIILFKQRRTARFVKSRYTSYFSVPDMLDELARLSMFYKIINGLTQVSFEDTIIMHLYLISVMLFIMNYF